MKNLFLLSIMPLLILSCQEHSEPIVGKYELEVNGMKNTSTGELEIVGEPNDYFGKIAFNSKRKRVYELGLKYKGKDSLFFMLPGNGGFLALKKEDANWRGKFKYFGIQAEVVANKIGPASNDLEALVNLKPIGRGVISTDQEEAFPSFDPVNEVLYFTREQKIYSSELNDSEWEEPLSLPFSQDFNDSAPYVFDNGQSLLFTSNRPIANSESKKKNLWLVNKVGDHWGDPAPLPSPINVDTLGDYHGAAVDKDRIYFISYNRRGGYGKSDLYRGEKDANGEYKVSNLGERLNSDLSEADIYVHPEEKYLLFASTGRKDSYGADDIYLSFKEGENWSLPINIGPKVNSFAYEYGAWVDLQNEYLYFNSFRRGTSDIYRIKLEELEVFQ